MHHFEDLGLSEDILKALSKKGFEEYTPIQGKIIPLLLEDKFDIIGQAQTGTGKTAAFGLPLIEKIQEKPATTQAIILAPTRELALQVSEEINSFKGHKKLNIVPIYGGQSMSEQFRRLKQGAHIIVGTPGRVIDHIDRGSINLAQIRYFVLDEADEMLNMGFIDDIEKILKNTSKSKRVLLFSATMPKRLLAIAEKYMGEKKIVTAQQDQLTTQLTNQIYFEVSAGNKFEALCRIIDIEASFYGVVFCRTKVDVENVVSMLMGRGYAADGLHGDITQQSREKILHKFKQQKINILVATDVAARGIDIHNLSHVINYSLPSNPESYVHRIGRTGRAGKQGTAITFVTPDEYRKLIFIKKITKTDIRKEKLPKVADIIRIKTARIKTDIENIMQEGDYKDYIKIAESLIKSNDPEVTLAAVLKYAFADKLDEKNYSEIQESSLDKKGKTRLFVALGKQDGMTPSKLESFLRKKTTAPNLQIRDVEIFDRFSFINVPFEEAEMILQNFQGGRGKSLVTHARKKERK